ncbi:UDP-N-acetylmuramate dehydrogenase [Pseudobutyrivibrio sp. NOR37]|uniref:UDP-N-acetylenolpyruvoylglucosamine reductase n=1 Tax=Pseudobutyrivibrio xylanivorans TaxID=185007 RepID=A0A6M0LI29_PSEXY|nr:MULTISPECIES: UDP-N-acetylmuramate dehydrogenase [Pseudobutyrivibrio]NEX01599.1 UDP-N-acetylmuramate dehydrogenase [Pseudobutyrivibrio xylanivorans]SFR70455.1 UDP-N-acetylmuramate dehydrogenase [Pseudobutyrivibrio sp. NOR37]
MLNKNYKELAEDLNTKFPEALVFVDEPMKGHTTFRIGGPADIYIEPDYASIIPLIKYLKEQDVQFMIIGNGSNLLVSDEGIDGVVISLGKNSDAITINGDTMVVEAGAMLSSVANAAANAGLTGLEFASGIPGSIGGAVYMNAGAYGGEMKDIIESVLILTDDLETKVMTPDDLHMSYRHSSLMEDGGYVLSAVIKLDKGNEEEIKARIDDIRQQRISKQPLNFPSAGSTFKRPEGYFAGKLIDDTGLRGYSVGDAQVSEKHCGFVVNKGNAKAADVLQLMKDVDVKVFDKFGVHLSPEVRIVGRNIH